MIVADASVLVNALSDTEQAGQTARTLLADEEIAVPDFADVEVVSALRGLWLGKKITARRFATAVDDLLLLPAERYPSRPLMTRAVELRANVHPHDATYVALAEMLACRLVTTDKRLGRASGPRCRIEVLS